MGFIVGVSSLGFTVVPAFQWRSQDFYAFGRCCCPRTFIGSAHKQVPVAPEHRRTMHSDAGVAARGRFIFVLLEKGPNSNSSLSRWKRCGGCIECVDGEFSA